jgi:membrane fusion protein (multidrug efflux system)
VEIVDGLAAGDTVVTAGQLKLRDGTPITVKNAIGERGDGESTQPGDAA